jgi:hypothetical protein
VCLLEHLECKEIGQLNGFASIKHNDVAYFLIKRKFAKIREREQKIHYGNIQGQGSEVCHCDFDQDGVCLTGETARQITSQR